MTLYSNNVIVPLKLRLLAFCFLCMCCRYEEQLRERQGQLQKEDLSDMVAEHAAKQKVRAIILILN